MAINIIKEKDIYVTEEELNKYREEYLTRYSMYVGSKPSLENYIKARKNDELEKYEQMLLNAGRLFKK